MTVDLLGDRDTYRLLTSNPIEVFRQQLESLLIKALDLKIISKNECEFMLPKHPQTATFFTLPKVHKGLNPLRG